MMEGAWYVGEYAGEMGDKGLVTGLRVNSILTASVRSSNVDLMAKTGEQAFRRMSSLKGVRVGVQDTGKVAV